VHQLVADADLDALDAALSELRAAGVTGLFIWPQIDDQRQRPFVTASWTGRGFQEPADIQGRMRADRRECLRGGGQTPLL
jgi:hypothetical protein